ncbi:unnamed protein product [Penicillium discolor]
MTRLAVLYYALGAKLPPRIGTALLRNRVIVRVMSMTMAKTRDPELRRFIHDQHDTYFSRFSDRDVLHDAFVASVSHDVREFAPAIGVPTLLIAAQRDDITPIEAERKLVTLFPDASLVEIAQVGHLIHYETPAEAAGAIRFPSREADEPGHSERDYLTHGERGLGPLHTLDREDPGVRVEQMTGVAARHARQQVDGAAQTVCLDDLRDARQLVDDAGELGLADADADERLQREPEDVGGEGALVGEEDAALFQPGHPRLDGVARQAHALGESDDRHARVVGEGREKLQVDPVQSRHSAKP